MVAVTINGQTAQAAEGASLFDCAEGLGIQVPTSCQKQGKCKECIVEVTEGIETLSEPTEQEKHLKGNFRLSCQARVRDRSGPRGYPVAAPMHLQSRDREGAISNPRLARQPEIALKVPFLLRRFRKALDAFRNLDDALLALALLPAGSGNLYAQAFGAIEERGTFSRLGRLSVNGDIYQSALASSSALTDCATSSAEPSRSSSSLHFHCAM